MDQSLKQEFIEKWKKYFGSTTELPITFCYSNKRIQEKEIVLKNRMCNIGQLAKIRKGQSLSFSSDSVTCSGGKAYCGFSSIMPGLAHFLSTGRERYLKNPEIAQEAVNRFPVFDAPAKYLSFKRWDYLTEDGQPDVVIFFAKPDVISGLFALANYDQTDPFTNVAPFSSGCGSIVTYPYQESKKENPKTILGMFDVSARPFVPENTLSFAIPMKKFENMLANMDESFLITNTWLNVKKRIIRDNT